MISNAIHITGEESEAGLIAGVFRKRIRGKKKGNESEKAGGDQPATKLSWVSS